jgi:hypothetical protein
MKMKSVLFFLFQWLRNIKYMKRNYERTKTSYSDSIPFSKIKIKLPIARLLLGVINLFPDSLKHPFLSIVLTRFMFWNIL